MYLTTEYIKWLYTKKMHIVQILCFKVQVLLLIVPASGASLAAGEYGVCLPAKVVASVGII